MQPLDIWPIGYTNTDWMMKKEDLNNRLLSR
jgi:hypothetical protein